MKHYVGKTTFDCNLLIAEITNHSVIPSHGFMPLNSTDLYYDDSVRQTKILEQAGYTPDTVEYRHYKSGFHFGQGYVDQLSLQLNVTPIMCWISEIRPGKCTPWHWDINPWEKEHEKLGELVRYFCFVSSPAPGHIFVTEDDAYYLEDQGSIYQYLHTHECHAGSNVGLGSKFLLTLTAYR
jgi:hypothetical protein